MDKGKCAMRWMGFLWLAMVTGAPSALAQQAHCTLVGVWGEKPDTTDGTLEALDNVEQPVGRSATKSEVLEAAISAASKIPGVPKSIDSGSGIVQTEEWNGRGSSTIAPPATSQCA